MKLLAPIIVALLVGIGIGIGAGTMMTKPKIEENKTRIAELESMTKDLQDQNEKLESSKNDSEEVVRKASIEIARYKNELKRAAEMIRALSADLKQAQAGQTLTPTETEETSTASTPTTTTPGPMVATVDYVVKDGDSLWKIAATELDNGMRYKEILKLNPTLSEDKPLVVGTKIKLPSQ